MDLYSALRHFLLYFLSSLMKLLVSFCFTPFSFMFSFRQLSVSFLCPFFVLTVPFPFHYNILFVYLCISLYPFLVFPLFTFCVSFYSFCSHLMSDHFVFFAILKAMYLLWGLPVICFQLCIFIYITIKSAGFSFSKYSGNYSKVNTTSTEKWQQIVNITKSIMKFKIR